MKFFEADDPASRAKLAELASAVLCSLSSETFQSLSENLYQLLRTMARSERKSDTTILKEWIELLREGTQGQSKNSSVTDVSLRNLINL